MVSKLESLGWALAFAVVVALAIPWFMWRDATVVAGLPAWLWWHVGWMVVAAGVFALFARRAWGLGIESEGGAPR
ncbi:DUF3311 domain-containing protein [Halorussus salilacus]|uniref:DUF3311 domain-containing protein n=1 Tax=Halorussus salilacus TaxID=2953750 RepID=UPI00209FD677|nr:DUF3311 domain-containing protein [Halorussus salilacus]USZ67442.1 DUF3311 domain-containing protein [Halorussus salilacus]